jgi:hypothetical protein
LEHVRFRVFGFGVAFFISVFLTARPFRRLVLRFIGTRVNACPSGWGDFYWNARPFGSFGDEAVGVFRVTLGGVSGGEDS